MTECDTLMFSIERDCDMFSFECGMNALKREYFNSIAMHEWQNRPRTDIFSIVYFDTSVG